MKRLIKTEYWKKMIDRLAYGSLVLDVCIATITTGSLMYPDAVKYLVPVNVLLTIVVIFSLVSALMIIGIKFYNKTLNKNKNLTEPKN